MHTRAFLISSALSWRASGSLTEISCKKSAIRYNESARLMQRADFDAAKTAAPEWCRDALKTINELELEIERR